MIQIEKVTRDGDTLYFEKYNRKELAGIIREKFENAETAVPGQLEDFHMYWTLADGTCGELSEDTRDPKPAASKIKNLFIDNDGCSTGFFGNYEIVQDEKYGDWNVEGI